jgi:PD-(D/E)XK nuclease superfamily
MENYIDIIKDAREQLMDKDKTISVKDLTLCHRKKVFTITDPVPMSDVELYNYVSGQADHDVMERLFMMYPNRFKTEMEVRYKNIKGKIDIFDKYLNNVIDTKTSKSLKILLKPFKFHEEQVRSYMAMTDSEEGQVIYQMNHFEKYHAFPIYMTSEERKRQLEKLESEAKFLLNAISMGDPSLVKGIYNDNEINWLCNKCPYLDKCRSIRHHDTNVSC